MSNIPEARVTLEHLLNTMERLNLSETRMAITEALALMTRKKPIRKTPRVSVVVGSDMAERIRRYATEHPLASQMEIAGRFNTNPGRVSEAMNGLR